jgi:prephenate dehydrogenase
VTMDAELHDTATAGISHLPLLLAAALTGSVALGPQASAATGWQQRTLTGWQWPWGSARGR